MEEHRRRAPECWSLGSCLRFPFFAAMGGSGRTWGMEHARRMKCFVEAWPVVWSARPTGFTAEWCLCVWAASWAIRMGWDMDTQKSGRRTGGGRCSCQRKCQVALPPWSQQHGTIHEQDFYVCFCGCCGCCHLVFSMTDIFCQWLGASLDDSSTLETWRFCRHTRDLLELFKK